MRKRSFNIMIILALMTGLLFSATAAGLPCPQGRIYKPVDVGPETIAYLGTQLGAKDYVIMGEWLVLTDGN